MEVFFLLLGAALCLFGAMLGMYVAEKDEPLEDQVLYQAVHRLMQKFK